MVIPPNGLFNGTTIYKWLIWGYPYFRKPPYNAVSSESQLFIGQ